MENLDDCYWKIDALVRRGCIYVYCEKPAGSYVIGKETRGWTLEFPWGDYTARNVPKIYQWPIEIFYQQDEGSYNPGTYDIVDRDLIQKCKRHLMKGLL